tara:strand:+ start:585 stop:1601 length:1017 start_codon:yes stop_codon:yes gene_type:complete
MIFSILLLSLIFLLVNYLLITNRYLLDKVDFSNHKKFIQRNETPITGGLFLLSSIFFFTNKFDITQLILLTSIFLIGFISDIYKNFPPLIRLMLQILITLFFIYIVQISIEELRIKFLDEIFLKYKTINIIFTIFCITVLINGSNFIDGVNLSSTGYYLGLFITLYYLSFNQLILIDIIFVKKMMILLSILLIFNFFNKTLLGDGGVYLISFLTGFLIIDTINGNKSISPYFGVLVLWYPCFENLFSIIRKKIYKKKSTKPDNLHLHQLIYRHLSVKFSPLIRNNLTGFIILSFNFIIFYLAYYFFYDSKILILIFFIAVLIYVISYIYLNKNNSEFK